MTFTYDKQKQKQPDSVRSNDVFNNGFNSSRGYAPAHFIAGTEKFKTTYPKDVTPKRYPGNLFDATVQRRLAESND